MRQKNGGFSLIELIVSIAILAIVSLTAMGFMASGANSFSSVSGNVSLQVRSQLAMGNIQEKMIDCNFGLDFHDATDTLYIINSKIVPDPAHPSAVLTVYTVGVYEFRDGAIYFGEHPCTLAGPGQMTFSGDAPDLLVKGVSDFTVSFQSYTTLEGGLKLSGATINILFTERGRQFRDIQTTALRNNPIPLTVTATSTP
ncbi:MAG: prepilin-type N-terminal cleavage/methylation domain-containing protein [Clostridiales bacterium]|nr:prepilin-type N-terminal cleavage/methylation domain-containing protein [Clostridiales bacterium]